MPGLDYGHYPRRSGFPHGNGGGNEERHGISRNRWTRILRIVRILRVGIEGCRAWLCDIRPRGDLFVTWSIDVRTRIVYLSDLIGAP